jgi:hypothetical protein
MLILPPGHAQAVGQRRALRPRERWMVRAVAGVLAAIVVAVVISVATSEKQPGRGCVNVNLAYSTGGAHISRCGAAARSLCQGVGRAGGITGVPAQTVATACRRAGLPVG